MKDLSELERTLFEVMVCLVVRYPDGMERIDRAVDCVREAGGEMDEKLLAGMWEMKH